MSFILKELSNKFIPLKLTKAFTADTEAPFLDLHLSIANGFVSSKSFHDFDLNIVNFPFLDGGVPRRGVYVSQLIRFAGVCNHVADFNARNKCLTAELLQQGCRYHKLRNKHFLFFIVDSMNLFPSLMLG